jgi:hypothetical protein
MMNYPISILAESEYYITHASIMVSAISEYEAKGIGYAIAEKLYRRPRWKKYDVLVGQPSPIDAETDFIIKESNP